MQIINLIFPWPSNESLKILVSLEFLNGTCVLDFYIKADMQWPRHDKLPLMLVNYWIRIYFYAGVISEGILNFYDPAKSTILKEEYFPYFSRFIWKIEWDRELFAFAWVDPMDLFLRPIIK